MGKELGNKLPITLSPTLLSDDSWKPGCQGADDTGRLVGLPGPRTGQRRGRLGLGSQREIPCILCRSEGVALLEPLEWAPPKEEGSEAHAGQQKRWEPLLPILRRRWSPCLRTSSPMFFYYSFLRLELVPWPQMSYFIRDSSKRTPETLLVLRWL